MATIKYNVEGLTNNVRFSYDGEVVGDGVFDKLMITATKHLQAQFQANRIRSEQYASAYVAIYQATLEKALQLYLQEDLYAEQVDTEVKKQKVYDRQIQAFDDDMIFKNRKQYIDAYNLFQSTIPITSETNYPDSMVTADSGKWVDEVMKKMRETAVMSSVSGVTK